MNDVNDILDAFRQGKFSIEDTKSKLKSLFCNNLGHSTLDIQRQQRTGHPEVVFCQGKTVDQITDIFRYMSNMEIDILATRMEDNVYEAITEDFPGGTYHREARIFTLHRQPRKKRVKKGMIAVVSGGTSDSATAEEAAVTAEFYGNNVLRVNDVGVAGIHRLFSRLDEIRQAKVVIAVAGMEGALASVVAGLVEVPVIAVPTSVGYGANFQGLAPLLAMLNSCASGVAVVNIDNGFGAGYMAERINNA